MGEDIKMFIDGVEVEGVKVVKIEILKGLTKGLTKNKWLYQ